MELLQNNAYIQMPPSPSRCAGSPSPASRPPLHPPAPPHRPARPRSRPPRAAVARATTSCEHHVFTCMYVCMLFILETAQYS